MNANNHEKPERRRGSAVKRLVSRILKKAETKTLHELYSVCDGYVYNIEREYAADVWYIQVWPEEESFSYDGYWRDSEGEPLENAIREAIEGAMVLDG